MKKEYRIIVSGGGTGGHIFPALSIADTIRSKHPDAKILFVGADNRMEMQRVPDAGSEIVGLPIAGFNRKNILKLSSPSPPAPNPSQHQSLFQWVNSSHEEAKVLEFQLQHHFFQ